MTKQEAIEVLRRLAERLVDEAAERGDWDDDVEAFFDACAVLDGDSASDSSSGETLFVPHVITTKYPVKDWQHEVANGDTYRGYWDWVQVKQESDEIACSEPQPHEVTP